MQAIVTKFLGPTNSRGSRIKATASAASITVSYDHRLNPEQNHDAACRALVAKLGWNTEYYGLAWSRGELPGGDGNCYVGREDDNVVMMERSGK
jgi:hypothetical protein